MRIVLHCERNKHFQNGMVIQSFEKHALSKQMGKLPYGSRMWKCASHQAISGPSGSTYRHCRGSSKKGKKWNDPILQKSSQLFSNWINLYIMYPYLLMISIWHTSGTPFKSIICSTLNGVVEAQRLRPQQRRCREMATNMASAEKVWRHVKTVLQFVCACLMMIQVLWMINIVTSCRFTQGYPFWILLVGAEIVQKWPSWAAWLLSQLIVL